MISNDDDFDLFDEKYSPTVTVSIHRPGPNITEYSTLSIKGDAVDNLPEALEFFVRALNAMGFTYVDSLSTTEGF